ncbi:MAG: ABC transporter substrate-binding protein, partial [Betaproteobacteria bacterium]
MGGAMRRRICAFTLSLALASGAQAADKVKVGFISTLSGPSAALGVDIRDGFQLAVKMNGGKLG